MSRSKNREKPLKSSVAYFERVISGHTAVESLTEISENVYEMKEQEDDQQLEFWLRTFT